MKKRNEEKCLRAIELKKQGISRKDIADELKVNVRTISIWTKHILRVVKLKSKEDKLETRREWYQKNNESEQKRLRVSNKKRKVEKLKWIQNYKRSKGCCQCIENEPVCLDFHHISDDKEANIASVCTSWSQERLQKELDKCIVICANCHRKLHFLDNKPA